MGSRSRTLRLGTDVGLRVNPALLEPLRAAAEPKVPCSEPFSHNRPSPQFSWYSLTLQLRPLD